MPRISYFYPARLDRSAVEKAPIYFGVFFVGSNKDKNYKSKRKIFLFSTIFLFFLFFLGYCLKFFLKIPHFYNFINKKPKYCQNMQPKMAYKTLASNFKYEFYKRHPTSGNRADNPRDGLPRNEPTPSKAHGRAESTRGKRKRAARTFDAGSGRSFIRQRVQTFSA